MGVRGDASAAAARDLEKAEEAKYYLSEYDPGRLVAYLFRNGRPREAFEELTGQTEAPLARAIVVSAVEAEQEAEQDRLPPDQRRPRPTRPEVCPVASPAGGAASERAQIEAQNEAAYRSLCASIFALLIRCTQ